MRPFCLQKHYDWLICVEVIVCYIIVVFLDTVYLSKRQQHDNRSSSWMRVWTTESGAH